MNTSHNVAFSHDLTISLIVRNEEANLPACLQALSPLRDALSCQLIVTDTGSTDATRDIALQYADLVLDFPWCDDFSKARNHAIPHATGRWFFYIDADEVCDSSVVHIADFLKSPESHHIGAVTLICRNYYSPPSPSYSDFQTPRLVNFGKGPRYFKGTIHESFIIHKGTGTLPVILHHSGYLKENSEKKQNRNTPLLKKEVEQRPQDLRTYVHLIQDLPSVEETSQWVQKALEVTTTHPATKQQFFYPALLIETARLAGLTQDISFLSQARQKLLCDPELRFQRTLPQLELLGLELDFLLKYPTTAYEFGLLTLLLEYHQLYHHLKEQPDVTYHGILAYLYAEPFHFARLMVFGIQTLMEKGEQKEAKQLLSLYKGYQWQNQNRIYPFLAKTTTLSMALEEEGKLQEILFFLKEHGPEKDLLDFSRILKGYLASKNDASASMTPPSTSSAPAETAEEFAHALTISLIVKNEEETLARCLQALSPLRDAISCQLIITDTGSTDRTKEIAQSYADLFLEFDWCNDFAKARNHAIPHATGRWFFYLDADEICDDTLLQVAHFLNAPQSHTMGSATVTVRNYQGETKDLSCYKDASLARLVNFGRGKRYFEGMIHESIPVHRASQILPVLLHHEGYLNAKNKDKEGRNKTLLLQVLEENPDQLQHYIPLLRELTTAQEKRQWFDKAFSVVEQMEQGRDHFSFPSLLLEKARFALAEQRLDLLEEATTLLQDTPALLHTLPHLELLGLSLELHLRLSSPVDLLLPLFSSYRSLFLALQETPDTQYPLASVFTYHTPLSYHSLELDMLSPLKDSPLLDGGRALLHASTGYQVKNQNNLYPLLPKTTFLCLELEMYQKLDEILDFLKKQGALKDFMDVTHLFTTHLKEKGGSDA